MYRVLVGMTTVGVFGRNFVCCLEDWSSTYTASEATVGDFRD